MVGSILTIVVAVALILVVLKLVNTIAKPLMAIIIIVAAGLLIFGIVDFSAAVSQGKSILENLFQTISQAAK